MNRKVINCTFLVIIVSLMFENLPKLLSPGFISGPLFGKLVFFPVAFGMIYTLYYKIRQSHNIEPSINIIKYIILYIFFMVLSLFLGIDRYPYYQSIITHIKTFPLNIQLLNLHSMFQIDNIILVKLVVFTKALKNIIMDIFWNIGGCFLIYYWYKDHWQDAKLIMEKAILILK